MAGRNVNRIKTSNTWLVWILAGLVLGFVLGFIATVFRTDRRVNDDSRLLFQLTAVSEYKSLALLEYKYADTAHALKAIQDLITFMDRLGGSKLVANRPILAFDRSVAYTRLALLDEKIGDMQGYRHNLAFAAQCGKGLGDTHTSEKHLREGAENLDFYLP
jgi:hypothetical protein